MPDERADRPAVRARRPLEPLDHRGPLCFVPVEPPLAAHDRTPARKPSRVPRVRRAGEEAGADKFDRIGKAGSPNRTKPQNRIAGFTKFPVDKHSPHRIAIR